MNLLRNIFCWAGCLLLSGQLLAADDEQTIVLTAPCTNLTVAAGDEYATTYVGNPWNMDQLRDIPFELGFAEPTVANNEWSSTFLSEGAAFYPLWRGFSTATTTSYPCHYDGAMPMGTLYPIDTAKYSRLSMRISMNKSDRSSFWVVWTTNANQVEYAPNGSIGFVDGDYCMVDEGGTPHSQMYPDGYRVYDLGFTVEEFFAGKVRDPCAGFNNYGAWSGRVYGFLVEPSLNGASGTAVRINWIRLYDPTTSPKLQITWTTTGVSLTNNYLYGVQVWMDADKSGYDGELFASCLENDGAYEINTAALPAGTYYFYLKLLSRGATEWTELARSGYSAALTVSQPPSIEFTAPTYTSGDDYATVELGNPWDMEDSSDIYDPLHISNISFQDGILIATADGPVPPATESDSQFYLNTKLNGEWKAIDASKYHYLTFRIMVDRTGYTNINDWVARGWLSRAVWFNTAINVDGSEAQGIPLFENWHSYTVDLADRALLTTENPYPAQVGWTELGEVKRLRFDPLEVLQATSFGVEDVKLCADNKPVADRYTISWVASDPDSQTLSVSLLYGTGSGNSFIGTPIGTVTQAPGAGSYVWDTTVVHPGSYYIQAVVCDGSNSVTRTSLVPLVVGSSDNRYFSLTNAAAIGADFDGDGLADPALYQESSGNWQVKLSSGNYTVLNLPGFMGGTGYSALAADFDGDGKADPAVYNTANGDWVVKLSGNGYASINLPGFLGGAGYTALAGDFDGDAKADPAVYQAANGGWIIKLSSTGYGATVKSYYFGVVGYTALADDFDGDGLADYAVYQEKGGNWMTRLSAGRYLPLNKPGFLGGSGYSALAADFDGDGLADYAIYQSTTGVWQMKLSSASYAVIVLSL
jgi:hypothetical protein